jgi:chromosome segregation ATPase
MALDRSDIDIIAEAFRRAGGGGGGTGGSLRAGQSSGGSQPDAAEIKKLTTEAANASREFTKLRAGMRLTSQKQFEFQTAQRDVNNELSKVEDALVAYNKGTIALSKEEKKTLEARRKELSSLSLIHI